MNTIRFFGLRVWNAIDERIKSKRSVGLFKSSLKRAHISQYVSQLPLPCHSLYVSFFILIIFYCVYLSFLLLPKLLFAIFSFLYFSFHCLCITILCSLFCVSISIVHVSCLFVLRLCLSDWLFYTSFCLHKQPHALLHYFDLAIYTRFICSFVYSLL